MLPPMQFSYKAGSSERRNAVRYTPNSAVLRYYSADAVNSSANGQKASIVRRWLRILSRTVFHLQMARIGYSARARAHFEDRHIACRASLNTLAL